MKNITKVSDEDNIFNYATESFKRFLIEHNRSPEEFICRDCGELMFDKSEVVLLHYHDTDKHGNVLAKPIIYTIDSSSKSGKKMKPYRETELSRWVFYGKAPDVSSPRYYRRICWKCLFKKIPEYIKDNDKYQLIDKHNIKWWKRKLKQDKLKDILKIPLQCGASIWWFILIFDI